ncbi:MAG: IS4 family transposase, partial [Syntrophales bacterium]|nr:IS4 family transposase [Syntrophales bacterium]
DTCRADEEIVQTYKRRWDIEVFFKMAKSFLNLAKECQGRSYDALVAHATVVCCRYIMQALTRRRNNDPRTLGSLFYACCEELKQTSLAEALAILLALLEQTLNTAVEITKEPVLCHSLMERFLEELPPIYRRRLLLPWQNEAASC